MEYKVGERKQYKNNGEVETDYYIVYKFWWFWKQHVSRDEYGEYDVVYYHTKERAESVISEFKKEEKLNSDSKVVKITNRLL